MTTRHKHADVIIAWAEGAEVEYRNLPGATWVSASTPGWYENYEYRVKPPAKKYRVALFKDCTNVGAYTSTADSQEEANCLRERQGFVRWITDWIEYEED